MTDLGTLPGETVSSATGINPGGQIVGSSESSGGPVLGVLWDRGVLTATLNPVGTGCCATPEDINPAGEIVGASDLERELEVATLWSRR